MGHHLAPQVPPVVEATQQPRSNLLAVFARDPCPGSLETSPWLSSGSDPVKGISRCNLFPSGYLGGPDSKSPGKPQERPKARTTLLLLMVTIVKLCQTSKWVRRPLANSLVPRLTEEGLMPRIKMTI